MYSTTKVEQQHNICLLRRRLDNTLMAKHHHMFSLLPWRLDDTLMATHLALTTILWITASLTGTVYHPLVGAAVTRTVFVQFTVLELWDKHSLDIIRIGTHRIPLLIHTGHGHCLRLRRSRLTT